LRTADSVSPSLTGSDVLISLLAYMAVYLLMYPVGIVLMWRIVRRGPAAAEEIGPPIEAGRPEAPVLAGGNVLGGDRA
jgi:cytochrome d ubiquinol oxidase subunit I